MEFKSQILGKFEIDEEFESHVKAWREYHLAAEKIDGHYPIGRIPSDILSWAASAGYKAMRKVDPSMRARSNKGANVEALRRLEREGLIISESEKIRRHRG